VGFFVACKFTRGTPRPPPPGPPPTTTPSYQTQASWKSIATLDVYRSRQGPRNREPRTGPEPRCNRQRHRPPRLSEPSPSGCDFFDPQPLAPRFSETLTRTGGASGLYGSPAYTSRAIFSPSAPGSPAFLLSYRSRGRSLSPRPRPVRFDIRGRDAHGAWVHCPCDFASGLT
jgi:hypothetical protein